MRLLPCPSIYGSFLVLTALLATGGKSVGSEIDFNRDVRPILADHCFACHGPDAEARQAELRLDTQDGALEDRGGYAAFLPGDPDSSAAIERIFDDDPEWMMPPPDANLSLTPEQKEILKRWVKQGAKWDGHWAYAVPQARSLPEVDDPTWVRNEIDRFILSRLGESNLAPAPEADRATLLRRIRLDLTGLPPTPAEIAAFQADKSPDAYQKVVDRLLRSNACAERLTLDWLDLARYADSHGLHADGARRMWPWRDWVIHAFRDNMPYDQFVTLQLAGDLLPDATRSDRLATAFLRNHPMTAEGGVIDEEWRLNYVLDRAETTATALLGMTLECARCHDHKFDPLSQREYYQFTAFFNNVRELGMTGDDGDFGPLMMLPTDQDEQALQEFDREIDALEARLHRIERDALGDYQARESADAVDAPIGAAKLRPKATQHFPLNSAALKSESDDGPYLIDQNDSVVADIAPVVRPGIADTALFISGEYGFLRLKNAGLIETTDPLSAMLWVHPSPEEVDREARKTRQLLGTAGDKNQFWRGWELLLDAEGRLALTLTHQPPDNLIHVRSQEPIGDDQWTHVGFAYDGSSKASGVRLFVNGAAIDLEVVADCLTHSIYPAKKEEGYPRDPEREMRIGRSYRAFTGDFGIYHGGLDDLRLFDQALTNLEAAALYRQYEQAGKGSDAEAPCFEDRFQHWLRRDCKPWLEATARLRELVARRVEVLGRTPVIMVMEETATPRDTFVLERGQYDQRRDRVESGVPAAMNPWRESLPANRAGLADWMFDARNPLTARVAVNRYWQLLLGRGLVGTPHDFGIQGERPTHPELLDYLAVRFRESGWNLRELLRLIALSATYRQSSSIADWKRQATAGQADPLAMDPRNRLLWRGASYRLPAETIRDSALAASGLLSVGIGGPSAKPYQPEGLWIEKSNFSQELMRYVPDQGDGLYRRSLYTFIRRTSPPPSMETFDAPNRSRCVLKRETTNTPLQALVLLNDVQFVEAARVLAQQVIQRGAVLPPERIADVFRRLAGRDPNVDEMRTLKSFYERNLQQYGDDPAAAEALLDVGASPRDLELNAAEVAALAMVANTVMNYDAFYMKR